jgi:formate/nitrite transporter FocA (FNT family)
VGVFWIPKPSLPRIKNAMFAVIGNLVAGLLALSLFTATVRLTR